MTRVACLYVDPRGAYSKVPDVDLWDEARDARLYAGPHPVVAHPPCARWCRLAGLVEARWGHKRGDDGGTFRSALAAVRRWGGVLEHPAYSDAFPAHGLPPPPRHGGWQGTICGGFVAHVEQCRYGHRAKKATWLYAHGVDLPPLRWGSIADQDTPAAVWQCGAANGERSKAWVSWCGNHTRLSGTVERLGRAERSGTPPEFRDLLLAMARTARREAA